MKKLLIINYHDVVNEGKGSSYQKIEEDKFREQMRYLSQKGYNSLTFSELEKPLPKKAVIVSFDDGFTSVYQKAYPIMKEFGIKANVYLPTAYIGKDDKFMNWEMVKKLYSEGVEFQAHMHTHRDIRSLNREEIKEEIDCMNDSFLCQLGYIPSVLCIPFGTYDKKSLKLLKEVSGYKYFLGSFYGKIKERRIKKGGLFPRIGISDADTIKVFDKKLKGRLNWKGILQRLRLRASSIKGDRVEKFDY